MMPTQRHKEGWIFLPYFGSIGWYFVESGGSTGCNGFSLLLF